MNSFQQLTAFLNRCCQNSRFSAWNAQKTHFHSTTVCNVSSSWQTAFSYGICSFSKFLPKWTHFNTDCISEQVLSKQRYFGLKRSKNALSQHKCLQHVSSSWQTCFSCGICSFKSVLASFYQSELISTLTPFLNRCCQNSRFSAWNAHKTHFHSTSVCNTYLLHGKHVLLVVFAVLSHFGIFLQKWTHFTCYCKFDCVCLTAVSQSNTLKKQLHSTSVCNHHLLNGKGEKLSPVAFFCSKEVQYIFFTV